MISDLNNESAEPLIMGILNVTPDSFSDGNQFLRQDHAINHARLMIEHGVDIIDIGGESTRPGAQSISVQEEIDRVLPIIESIKPLNVKISIDTNKAAVMEEAAKYGIDLINDVNALEDEGAIEIVAKYRLPVCLMHMQGKPRTMQANPTYDNVIEDITRYLEKRITACLSGGILKSNICIDPGFGFGKTLEHNITLLRELSKLKSLNVPILAGISRKSMIGQITAREVSNRLPGSLAAALMAMQNGAKILRVHDVKETVDVKKMFCAVQLKNNKSEPDNL